MPLFSNLKVLGQRFADKSRTNTILLVLLILASAGLIYYCHWVLRTQIIFSHCLYIPIILAAFWWGRRGAWVAVLLGALLIASHLLANLDAPLVEDLLRSVMLVAVGLVVGLMSERALRSERDLRETRDYLDSLIRYANAPIIVWDREGKISLFNTAFEHLTGYRADEVIGKPLDILFSEATIGQTLKGQRWEGVEIPIRGKGEQERLLLWNSANIYAEDGQTLMATIAQGQDITERKAAEDALAASKAYTESIIQNFLDTLIVVDAEAKIQTVNPAACRLLGYTEEELKGQSVSMLFAKEEDKRVFQFFWKPEKAGTLRPQDTIRNHELTYKTKDGRLIPMLFNASMLTDEVGNVTGVVAGAKDITERKRAQETLRKTEEKFRNVIENIFKFVPEGLLVLTDKLNVFRRNKALEDLVHQYAGKLNYTEEELADIINEQVKMRIVSGEKSDIIIPRNIHPPEADKGG
ncbi:MAG: PAS domain S-box protein [Deltaproteobacteria bacterium]|nr:PAS domain S-box protein [Deltaproteobacteria bacterium]